MKTYKANQPSRYGLYVAPRSLDFRFVGADGELLQGLADKAYLRVPTPLLLLASPVMGALFVLAFPVIVIAFTLLAAAQGLSKAVRTFVGARAHWLSLRWEPATSYLKHVPEPDKSNVRADGAVGRAEPEKTGQKEAAGDSAGDPDAKH